MSEKVQERQAAVTAWVSRQTAENESTEEEVIAVRVFATEPALVRRGYGMTVNLKNYESARVDVEITVPTYLEEVDAADAFASQWCRGRLKKEIQDIKTRRGLPVE